MAALCPGPAGQILFTANRITDLLLFLFSSVRFRLWCSVWMIVILPLVLNMVICLVESGSVPCKLAKSWNRGKLMIDFFFITCICIIVLLCTSRG